MGFVPLASVAGLDAVEMAAVVSVLTAPCLQLDVDYLVMAGVGFWMKDLH